MTPQTKAMTILDNLAVLERAVLYARVSRDDRDKEGRNLTGQLEMGREYTAQRGYSIIDELSEDDRGASGAEIDLPQLNKIREMAYRGEFDILVVREIDRLSRNLAKQLIVEDELRRHGVRIEYVLAEYDDTPEGRLQKHIRATIAEYEREKIKERMHRGKRNKVKGGHVSVGGQRSPFGYTVVVTNEKTGSITLEINEAESKTVEFIFELFLKGLTVGAIRIKLTQLGIPTPADLRKFDGVTKRKGFGEWVRASVYNILTNPVYAGHWYYGKRRTEKYKKEDGRTGYIRVDNPSSSWVEVSVPPIISEPVFKFVQEQLKGNSDRRGKPAGGEWLFSKRVWCGECGYKICIQTRKVKNTTYVYYLCPSSHNRDFAYMGCTQTTFKQKMVDTQVWAWLASILGDKDKLEEELDNIEARRNGNGRMLQEQLTSANSQIEQFQKDLDDTLAVLKVLKTGGRAYATVLNDVERIEETLGKLESQRNRLLEQLNTEVLSTDKKARLLEYADEVAAGLEVAKDDFNLRKAVVDALDVKVTLIRENGKPIAYITCYLYDTEYCLPLRPMTGDKN